RPRAPVGRHRARGRPHGGHRAGDPLMAKRFDAIVIGTGQAGPALATRLAAAGRSVCIVERASFGGTCVNNGCTPTKTIGASAYAARMAQRAGEYGSDVGGGIKADMKRVKARKDEI